MSKKCGRCGETKDEADFYPDRWSKDGLQSRCRACQKAFNAWRYRDPTAPGHESVVRSAIKGRTRYNNIRKADPDHKNTWTSREYHWKARKILCLIGCRANEGYLCREHYKACWNLQEGVCGLCGGLMPLGIKPYPSADHLHADGPVGPFRGILHGGKLGCNVRLLSAYEHGKLKVNDTDPRLALALDSYLSDPPAARLADRLGVKRYACYRDVTVTIPVASACPGRVGSVYGEEAHDRA